MVAVAERDPKQDSDAGSGFLGRWARRKNDVRQGREPAPEPAPEAPQKLASAVAPSSIVGEKKSADLAAKVANTENTKPVDAATPATAVKPEPLTLEDAQTLTRESDYTPFMGRSVTPDVRNAAMKKLFTDPHFNVMDGLDIYIDDYSIASPMPASMLRQLASTKFLKFFEDEEESAKPLASEPTAATKEIEKIAPATASELPHRHDNTSPPLAAPTAQNTELGAIAAPLPPAATAQPITSQHGQPDASQTDHDNLDLRLQPDHAASAQKPGHGT